MWIIIIINDYYVDGSGHWSERITDTCRVLSTQFREEEPHRSPFPASSSSIWPFIEHRADKEKNTIQLTNIMWSQSAIDTDGEVYSGLPIGYHARVPFACLT